MNAINEKHLKLIEKYLIDDLSAGELDLFNKELKNEAFRNELLEQARNLDALDEIANADFKTELLNNKKEHNTKENNTEPPKKQNFKKWLLFGLSILLLSIFAYLLLPKEKEQIYLADTYFTPYPPDSNIRGVESTKTFSKAMKSYANADYAEAISEFEKINPKNENLELYLACAYLKVGKFSDAYNTLSNIPNDLEDLEIQQNRDWFQAISLLGLERVQEAKALLETIKNNEKHLFMAKAKKLLSQL